MKNKPLPFGETQNSKKLWAYYKALTKTEEFNQDIYKARKKLNIPIKGLKKEKYTPPRSWNNLTPDHRKLIKEIDILCEKYNLFGGHWWIPLEHYIFYSELSYPDIYSGELLTLTDSYDDSFSKESIENFKSFYPLSIMLSPYASLRDILDWVKKNYHDIKFFQDKYKNKNVKINKYRIRREKLEKRNDYIYKNRSKKLSDLEVGLDRLGYDMDQGSISKIISLETKRRKKV